MPALTYTGRERRRWLLTALGVIAGSVASPLVVCAPQVSAVALFKDRAVLLIDGRSRTLKAGDESPEGVRLLQADAGRARVVIDGHERELLLDGLSQSGGVTSREAVVVRLLPGDGGHYFADGQINGNPVHFVVDTGATTVTMNKHMARRIGLSYMVDGHPGRVETASGVAAAYGVMLNEVKVQSLRLGRVQGTVIDGDFPSEVLLGQSFLNRLDIHRSGAVLELRAR